MSSDTARLLERSEVFVPGAIGKVRGMPLPLLQGKKIFHGDLALFGAIKKMLAELGRQVQPFDLRY